MQQPLDGPGESAGDDCGVRPLRTRLHEARRRLGIPWEVLERDYLLSWVLAGISQMPMLRDSLVFKGGTALRKCYFGDYRFSEDLDFSGLEGVPTGEEMERLVNETCEVAVRLLDEYAPVEIFCERYTEREPHPDGQEAFSIRARLPWQSRPQTRVMIEVTMDERVLLPAEQRQVIHDYGEPIDAEVKVYPLEEIVAEKLRALLQQAQMFEMRGWSRSRARALLRPLARARHLQKADEPGELRLTAAGEVRRTGSGFRRPGGILPRGTACLRREDLGAVARPASAWTPAFRDGH